MGTTVHGTNSSSGLELGIVSDEISPSFEEAVRYGARWGLSLYELRVLNSGRVPAIDDAELKVVKSIVEDRGVTITALSPGIFKHSLSGTKEILTELNEVLPRTIDLALQLGAPLIIVFGFQREAGESEDRAGEWIDIMRRACAVAAKSGITLAIENEPGFWCDSGANTARLIRSVNMDNLGANWDPCNSYGTPERPYPDGYEAVREVAINLHVKDTKKGSLIECVPVGEGVVDWKNQIAAVMRDGLLRHVTIETHCHPLIENSKRNVETLRTYISAAGANRKGPP